MNEISTEYVDLVVAMAIEYIPQLLLALGVLVVGLWVVGRIVRMVAAALEKNSMEQTLARFLTNLLSVGLKALLFVSVAGMVGIETTSFIAVLGAAGLAIGLALQGSLANFAGGVLILMFRPYKVGDVIEAEGVIGTVRGIQIFSTLLTTADNKAVIIPNGTLSNGIITNFSREPTRRVDFVFGIGYSDDIAKAKAEIRGLVERDERVLKDPAPKIVISGLGESSVDITVRLWVESAAYWDVFFDVTERVKLAFDQASISIPFPQRDVHIIKPLEKDGVS